MDKYAVAPKAECSQLAIVQVAVSGGLSGAVADTFLHSMDTVKTRIQGQFTTASTTVKYRNLLQTSVLMYKEEGIRALFGGLFPAAIGSLLSTTVYFGAYETIKNVLINNYAVNETISYFVAGGVGDLCASVLYVPSEVLKTRLQLQGKINTGYKYKSTLDAAQKIYSRNGFVGLYSGLGATLLRDVPFTALQFTFYETIQNFFRRRENNKSARTTTSQDLVSGVMAGSVAGFITTPLDVAKTYLQTQTKVLKKQATFISEITLDQRKIPSAAKKSFHSTSFNEAAGAGGKAVSSSIYYDGIIATLRGLYKRQGMRGLFSGYLPRTVWTGSQSMIMFTLYENIKNMIQID